jgi:hypothetical protein
MTLMESVGGQGVCYRSPFPELAWVQKHNKNMHQVAGVKMRDNSSIGKYPVVTHVRHASPCEYEGVKKVNL